jgi:hypothetical protein
LHCPGNPVGHTNHCRMLNLGGASVTSGSDFSHWHLLAKFEKPKKSFLLPLNLIPENGCGRG